MRIVLIDKGHVRGRRRIGVHRHSVLGKVGIGDAPIAGVDDGMLQQRHANAADALAAGRLRIDDAAGAVGADHPPHARFREVRIDGDLHEHGPEGVHREALVLVARLYLRRGPEGLTEAQPVVAEDELHPLDRWAERLGRHLRHRRPSARPHIARRARHFRGTIGQQTHHGRRRARCVKRSRLVLAPDRQAQRRTTCPGAEAAETRRSPGAASPSRAAGSRSRSCKAGLFPAEPGIEWAWPVCLPPSAPGCKPAPRAASAATQPSC
jgi:hypothetical protein